MELDDEQWDQTPKMDILTLFLILAYVINVANLAWGDFDTSYRRMKAPSSRVCRGQMRGKQSCKMLGN